MEEQAGRSLPPFVAFVLRQMPEVSREERLTLVEQLEQDGRWSMDFGVMMGLAAALATLGLMQGSGAVVIGAMLVAPLMTPLIACGFALVQGNLRLFRQALGTMGVGVAWGLLVSMLVGVLIPQSELSLEVAARASPNVIDLVVAFVSGVAAAYAIARPNVVAAVAGVAIAAALVPPLATVGIGLTRMNVDVAVGAALLLTTNLVAIILGAAVVFRVLGVRRSKIVLWSRSWVNRTVLVLVALSVVLMVPLGFMYSRQLATGQTRPLAYPVAAGLQRELQSIIAEYEGVRLVLAGRPGRDDAVVDAAVYLGSEGDIPASLVARIDEAVRARYGQNANVFILPLRMARVGDG